MPELPEVETVMRGLDREMTGATIRRVETRRAGLRWPFPHGFSERISGARVENLRRRAKFILVELSSGETLLVHLGMSGRFKICPAADSVARNSADPETPDGQKHDHVVITMENETRLTYSDPRRFGMMDLHATRSVDSHRLLSNLGPEPLGNAFNGDYLCKVFEGSARPVKSAMLDQRVVAGLGNIYVCEALWRTGISPTRKAGQISARRISMLVGNIRTVLEDAILAGGSSLRDYRRTDGGLGYFQHSFKVYAREGDSCENPDCDGIVTRTKQSGRSTFYCGKCQI